MASYTLLSDGSSDAMLVPLLDWLLLAHASEVFEPVWADLRRLTAPPTRLRDRIRSALDYYPCDLLFIHRDAESARSDARRAEIEEALEAVDSPPAVCVVPVRMTEAWLLFDDEALRTAAGNPNGEAVDLPAVRVLESVKDPKAVLHELLRRATGLKGRHLARFNAGRAAHRLASLVRDWSPLRALPAFQALEAELQSILASNGWSP